MSVILNVALYWLILSTAGLSRCAALTVLSILVITQFSDQVKVKDISPLTDIISNVLQKLLKCFNGIAILTSFVPVFFAT